MDQLISILNQSVAYLSSYALRCAVELDIAGRIQAYGRPMPLHELARSIPIPPEKDMMLGRLMVLLVRNGLFARTEEGNYMLTPSSELMLTEGSNVGAFVRFATDLRFTNYLWDISKWYKDEGREIAYEMANNGKLFWDITREKPDFGKLFDEAMASHSNQVINGMVSRYPQIFDGVTSLVDVGGGTGTAAKTIAGAFPALKCTVLDLPHVVANALKDDSFDVVGGDMFENIPPTHAILLQNVLHDWCDGDCMRILKRCREAIEPKRAFSKVIVVDVVLDVADDAKPKAIETSLLFDMLMLWTVGAKERTKQDWHELILESGYSDYKIYPAYLGVQSIIELYP